MFFQCYFYKGSRTNFVFQNIYLCTFWDGDISMVFGCTRKYQVLLHGCNMGNYMLWINGLITYGPRGFVVYIQQVDFIDKFVELYLSMPVIAMVPVIQAQGFLMCRKLVFYVVFFYHSLGGHRVSTIVLGCIYTHQNNCFHEYL